VSGEAFLNADQAQQKSLPKLNEPEWREVRGREIAMIFQEPMTSLNPELRIGTQIEEAIWAHEPAVARNLVDRRVIAGLEHAAVPEPDLSPYWNLLTSVARNGFITKALAPAY
jgi:ABC-type microcin C transport system duplicated ATPase subunit YejF